MAKRRWTRLARLFAQDAHQNHFASRRGVWYMEDLDVLVSDTGLEPDAAAQLGAAGPRVVLA